MPKLETTIEEFTSPSPITAKPDDNLEDIASLMQKNGIRHIPIVVEEKAVGIISDRDLKVALKVESQSHLTAKDLMIKDVLSVPLHTSIEDAAFQMSENKVGSLIVEDDEGKMYGIFTSTDALNALVEIIRGVVQ